MKIAYIDHYDSFTHNLIDWMGKTSIPIELDLVPFDDDFKMKALTIRNKISPPKVGSWGQLQEWKEDVDDSTSTHRHVSHLFALHPGKQISIEKTSELAKAAKVLHH